MASNAAEFWGSAVHGMIKKQIQSTFNFGISEAFFLRIEQTMPSDTKLLLTKNDSEIIIFVKITNFTRKSWKSLYFLEILRVPSDSKITKNNSQGINFVITSCQRVVVSQCYPVFARGFVWNPGFGWGRTSLVILIVLLKA